MAFFGAYTKIIIAVIYIAMQKVRGNVYMGAGLPSGWRWKWSFALLNVGVVGMAMGLLISGYEQSFVERALEGSSWSAYLSAQRTTWFMQGMYWREIWGAVTIAGLVIMIWDMLTIGAGEKRTAFIVEEVTAAA